MSKPKEKLTNEIIDRKLEGTVFKRIGNCAGSKIKIDFQCLIDKCNYVWLSRPDSIINGKRKECPECYRKRRYLTNEKIDQILINKNRNIKRIGNFIGLKIKIDWMCLEKNKKDLNKDCLEIWSATPDDILYAESNCRKCYKKEKLTNEEVDLRLEGKNIKRIGNYIDNKTKIDFQCLNQDIENINEKCLKIWSTSPKNILNNNHGCPKCGNQEKITNEIVDIKLIGRNIKRIGDYVNNKTKIDFQCLKCLKILNIAPSTILNNIKYGCSRCSGNEKLSNEIIDQQLLNKNINIKRLGNCRGNKYKIEWQCLNENCLSIWSKSPNQILSKKVGCTNCKILKKNENIVKNILEQFNINFEYQKYLKYINKYEIRNYVVDFYLENYKIIIEYNGQQHYKPTRFGGIPEDLAVKNFEQQKLRDKYIQDFADKNNIKIIWINGLKYIDDKLKRYLEQELIPNLLK